MKSQEKSFRNQALRAYGKALVSASLFFGMSGKAYAIGANTDWLFTQNGTVYTERGSLWFARGVNLPDSDSCSSCSSSSRSNDFTEVERRFNEAVKNWGANLFRLLLTDDSPAGSPSKILSNSTYAQNLEAFVERAASNPGVYIVLSVFHDPTNQQGQPLRGIPDPSENAVLEYLVSKFYMYPNVIFGIANEPELRPDKSVNDQKIWDAMNGAVQVIRDKENAVGSKSHLISVQSGGYSSDLSLFARTPIQAGGGKNILHEIHFYESDSLYDTFIGQYVGKLPIYVGEVGPDAAPADKASLDCFSCGMKTDTGHRATLSQTQKTLNLLLKAGIPYTAWCFHECCPPNLFKGPPNQCNTNLGFPPTAWGSMFLEHMKTPWTSVPSNPLSPQTISSIINASPL